MKIQFVIILIFVAIISFSLGSNDNIKYFFNDNFLNSKNYDTLETTNNIISHEEISDLIHIDNVEDLNNKKNLLFNFLWQTENLPSDSITNIDENVTHPTFSNISNLKKIDRFLILMEYDINSVVYLLHPIESNNDLVIYHEGHSYDFENAKKTINYFLDKGFSVLVFAMPLQIENNQPYVELDNLGNIQLLKHNQLVYLEDENFTPMKFFFEPITRSLNFIDTNYFFDNYYMIGISGGGWTTTIYSAMDDRVNQSFSISGSLPLFLRNNIADLGDYEQINPNLYHKVNYLELYLMAGYGENRSHTQFFIKNDPCCFAGEKFKIFSPIVSEKLSKLGSGSYQAILDSTTNKHVISDNVLELIHNSIK